MCGIVGLWEEQGVDASSLEVACRTLRHRGPDDWGVWCDQGAGLALGHTRLSILDLSPAGHQPMRSRCGRYAIAFNGEIYNHRELRAQLDVAAGYGGAESEPNLLVASGSSTLAVANAPGRAWRGHSDTETLLACITQWGLETTLTRVTGMFAFALWDRRERRLLLARDRLGEKPLYYGYVGAAFAFGSELKALAALPAFRGEIDRGALALLLRHNSIPAPHCIYRGIAKLPPGTWTSLDVSTLRQRAMPTPRRYWSAAATAERGAHDPLSFGSDSEAVLALECQVSRAVAGQMESDVPLGAFLSGGVDSSAVVALMQEHSRHPVRTFAIGFREDGYDEARHAGAVARHLGTEHTELYVSGADALAVIPRLPAIYDEPFSDSSQIPTVLLCQLARTKVAVALSGDGGDELFGGYTRYFLAARLWATVERFPHAMRRALAGSILALSPGAWDRLYRLAAPLVPRSRRWSTVGDKLHKGAALLDAADGIALYRGLVTHWDPSIVLREAVHVESESFAADTGLSSLPDQMMLIDALGYLPDDILVKVDRAAMAASLETRVPLIDHRLFEFAWRLPLHYKIRDGVGKWLLRQVLYRRVPQRLVDRPKMGFGVPIGSWLRGPLREWAEELLSAARLERQGFFHAAPIRRKWREHLCGTRNWQYHLWDVLMFQAWLEERAK